MTTGKIFRAGLFTVALMGLIPTLGGAIYTQARAQNGNMQAANNNRGIKKKKPYTIILPDLTIESVRAEGNDDRRLGILVANKGNVASKACNLKVFYHRSGQVMVRGVTVPPIAKGEDMWVVLDVGSPLANASSITMRVDDPNRVRESNEGNNNFTYK
jgi:hypothetical protein